MGWARRQRSTTGSSKAIAPVVALAALSLGGLLTACTGGDDPADETAVTSGGTVELDASDSGTEVSLGIGDVVVVGLGANPGTGFQWMTSIDQSASDAEIGVVEEVDRTFVEEADDEGSPGQEVIRFQAFATGQAIVVLDYRRPWQPEAEPERTFRFDVTVAD